MSSRSLGKNTSKVEVQDVGRAALWVYAQRKEYCLPYKHFPEFLHARVSEIFDAKLLDGTTLHWPKLGVTVTLEALAELNAPVEVRHLD